MTNFLRTTQHAYSAGEFSFQSVDDDLEPYLSLFTKPLTNRKSEFSKQELEVMCKDPLHSPKLILYLIDFVKEM